MYESAIKLIEKYDEIIIHRHSRPDGDAVGSQAGLAAVIRENYPGKKVLCAGDPAGRYSFIPGSGTDGIGDGEYSRALGILLDCSAASLVSDARVLGAKETLRIDHHIFVEKICSTEITDTSAESCCGMICDLAAEADLSLTPDAATALYAGLVTDSGRFRYDSTGSATFLRAARLADAGADIGRVYRELYAEKFENVKRRAEYILKIRFTPANTAYIYTTREELESSGADPFAISRGMVGVMGDIRGVGVWVNFTATDGGILCEIRSAEYNINPVAVKYGGGGHAKASGCTLRDEDEMRALLADLDALQSGKE